VGIQEKERTGHAKRRTNSEACIDYQVDIPAHVGRNKLVNG
jgi:hypothetical protein